jgi:DNA polymerase III subunit epsilon
MKKDFAREPSIRQAQKFLASQPVFLDTETTGFSPQDEIVEICIVSHDGETLIDALVRPKIPIPMDATRVHGITNEMVENAPAWEAVWPLVKKSIQGKSIAIYNADFDLRMIRQTNQKWNIGWRVPRGDVLCIMRLYAQFYGEWNPKYNTFRWKSLEVAGRQCGISIPNAHRAREDTLLAKAVLEHMAASK